MYRAKDRGRSRVDLFNADLHREALRRLDTEIALRTALFRTFNSHWVTSHVQGARNWPNGTRPIITITAATSRTAASRERARKAR